MLRVLCNELCIRVQSRLAPLVIWLAAWCGLKVVAADATLLPKGFQMFNVELAKQVGVDRAVMHQKLKGWQEFNQRKGNQSHYRQGRWWTYGRPEYWLENEFVWSSLSTIKRAFKDLEKAGLLMIDQTGGNYWLSALVGETVNLNASQVNVQLSLFSADLSGSNRPSSIVNPQTQKAKVKRQRGNHARPGIRKDAVADFVIPEHREEVGEVREAKEVPQEGRDILRELPGQLVTEWTDSKLPLEVFAAAHGVDAINREWAKTTTYKSRVAGLRTRLGALPSPRSAPPPSTGDTTEQDGTSDDIAGNDTPAVDLDADFREWQAQLLEAEKARQVSPFAPELLAKGVGASW